MSEPVKSSPGRPRSIRSHQAILKATLDLLGEVGYERMSIEAIAARAEVGKPTIYRRYASKEELVADAIESLREEISIPNTGSFWGDLDLIIESAAKTAFTPLNRQLKALIISTASTNPQFAQIYWTKYLQPRRQAFRVVIERAKTRNEVFADTDSDLIFDLISGISLYAQIFQPTSEPWEAYVRRALELFLRR